MDLYAAYSVALDSMDGAALVQCFTDDAMIETPFGRRKVPKRSLTG
jgi:hypothetical protein